MSSQQGRYSKVSRRVWTDEKFRTLSAPPPNAQTLWFRLLTGPELTNIPGAFAAWPAGMAQALGWPEKAFREAFGEVFAKGMAKADWEAGFVWVPKAIEYNRPESPNVVKSWRVAWAELPECPLKNEAYHQLKAFVEGMGEAFRKAFAEAFGEALPEALPEPVAVAVAVTKTEERERRARASVPESKTMQKVGRSDPLPPELRAAAEMIGVQDIDTCWLKFAGKYDQHLLPNVAGEWQSWCASWRSNERKERESRAARGGKPNVASEAPTISPEERRRRDDEHRAKERARRIKEIVEAGYGREEAERTAAEEFP